MSNAFLSVMLGSISAVIGYTMYDSWGVLVGAMVAPVSTLVLGVVRESDLVADFISRAVGRAD